LRDDVSLCAAADSKNTHARTRPLPHHHHYNPSGPKRPLNTNNNTQVLRRDAAFAAKMGRSSSVLALAATALPALGAAFLLPAQQPAPAQQQLSRRAAGRGMCMTRQGVQEKLERAFLRNAILDKPKHGYTVVVEESELDPAYRSGATLEEEEGVDVEAEVFSPLELKAMYGEEYAGPFKVEDIGGGIGDFSLPSFAKNDIIKGIVVRARCVDGWIGWVGSMGWVDKESMGWDCWGGGG
jgi:hypothetical protein